MARMIVCEISFNECYYQHKPLRSLKEDSKKFFQLEKENEGLTIEIHNA